MREQSIRNISLSEKEIERDKREAYNSIGENPKGMNLLSRLMAIKRLFNVLITTGYYTGIYLTCTLLFGYNRKRFETHTMRWAKSLINALNIKVIFEGDIPSIAHLMVANHRSYIDIPVLYTILPGVFLAKKEVKNWPILGLAARSVGTIFIDRSNPESRSKAKDEILQRVQNGEKIYVFPEGTTSPGPKLLDFKPGIFKMAAENFLPILPVAIQYSDKNDAWLGDDTFVGHFLRTFSKRDIWVKVIFCEPVYDRDPEALREKAYKSIYENLPDYSEVLIENESPT